MSPITIRQLQYFVAVYEEATFSKAALREHCSQPALSSQIRNLEQILNRALFERSVHGVTPTAAGQRFYRHSVAILHSVNSAKLEIEEVSGQVAGQVRAGLIPSIMRGVMPSFLPAFVETYPMIDIRLIQSFSDTLADAVLEEGAPVWGVIPAGLQKKELAHPGCTRLDIVATMHERKQRMADAASGFIALAGGFGTLDEFFEIVTWRHLGHHARPIVLFNGSGFWDPLLSAVSRMAEECFIQVAAEHFSVAMTAEDAVRRALAEWDGGA